MISFRHQIVIRLFDKIFKVLSNLLLSWNAYHLWFDCTLICLCADLFMRRIDVAPNCHTPNYRAPICRGTVITTLRSFAFNNINGFNRIDLSNNRIEILENYSFNNRMKINSINLSNDSIKVIVSYAFNNMWNVNSINISYNTIEILEENAFNGFDGNIDFKYNKIIIIGEFAFNNAAKYFDYISNPTPIVIDFSNVSLKSSAFRGNSFNVTNAKLIFNSNERIRKREKYRNLFFSRSH